MDCKNLACSQMTMNCRCYAKPGNESEQFCGYKKNSIVIPCDPGCCDGGCPGQCKDVPERPPYGLDTSLIDVEKFPLYIKGLIILIIFLIIVSTFKA